MENLRVKLNSGVKIHSAFALSTTLCIARQNLSIGVNVVSRGCGCPVDTSAKQKHRPRRQPRPPLRIYIIFPLLYFVGVIAMTGIGIFALILGVVLAVMGRAQNNDMEAQLESLFDNGTANPGDTFLYIGIAVAVVGLILLIVGLSKKKNNQ